MPTAESFTQSLRASTPASSSSTNKSNRIAGSASANAARANAASGFSTPTKAGTTAATTPRNGRRTSPIARLDTRAAAAPSARGAGGKRTATPTRTFAAPAHNAHETEAEHFWKTTLRRESPRRVASASGRQNNTGDSPYRGGGGGASVAEHSHLIRNGSRGQQQQQQQLPWAGFASDNVDPVEFERIEQMLITGVYVPSARIQKMEAMLSRELAMWNHVVAGSGGDVPEAHVAAASTPPPTPTPSALLSRPGSTISDAALSAVMAINAASRAERPAGNTHHSVTFAAPDASAVRSPREALSSTASVTMTSPPRGNAVASAAASIDGTLQARARERLSMLDAEVNLVDDECQRLIADLLEVQKRQSAQDGDAAELNALFTGVQRALTKSQERRERLVALRKQLLAEMSSGTMQRMVDA